MEWLQDIFLFNEDNPLIFTRFYFWGFFTIVLAFYTFIYKFKTSRSVYLFLVSLFFYYKTSGIYFLLLIFSTICDFFIGKGIYNASSQKRKKVLVGLSVLINLLLLGYFKYSYLMVESINYLLNTDFEVINYFAFWSNKFGNTHFDISQIVLPVGISFYTFQTISYSVDIYRNKVTPLDNILEFGFYVSFFPQLVAGPIVRAANFIPQIRKEYNLTEEEFSYGVYLILKGLMKKMFIGDYIAVNFVDRVFANPLLHSGFENILSLYGYSLQVYCDFSGYTDIAIGIALLMGFYLPKNFNSPYKAINVGDFWRRWHISLSSWLKDYLYIPLGGNRKGPVRTNINIMLTMLLGGLWHGASWKFVTWGGLNGLGLLTWKYWRKISPYEKYNNVYSRFLKIFITFTFITFTRIWFRADNWDLSMQMLQGIFRGIDTSIIIDVMTSYYKVLLVMLLGYIIHWLPENFKVKYRDWFMDRPIYQKAILSVIVIFIIYQTYTADLQPFIYFQF